MKWYEVIVDRLLDLCEKFMLFVTTRNITIP